tara:strand:+ start:2733 stop:2951 length:219 start_codon:yes stop_codon:yes gene_type:complete
MSRKEIARSEPIGMTSRTFKCLVEITKQYEVRFYGKDRECATRQAEALSEKEITDKSKCLLVNTSVIDCAEY